jgi:hypothetical protein
MRRLQGRLWEDNAKKQALERRRSCAQVRVIKAPRVQLAIELDGISEKPTSCRRRTDNTINKPVKPTNNPFHSQGSAKGRCLTRKYLAVTACAFLAKKKQRVMYMIRRSFLFSF